MQYVGVDGCPAGWFYIALSDAAANFGVAESVEELLKRLPPEALVLIDIPIGLPDTQIKDRACDVEARSILAPRRSSSVFPTPSRSAVYSPSYEAAQKANRSEVGKGISKQTWGICEKIREVDRLMQDRPEVRERIREVHPELCFWGLAGRPMEFPKRTPEGFGERIVLLEQARSGASWVAAEAYRRHGGSDVNRDDVLDALVAAICAERFDESMSLPDVPILDGTGLRMEMVYWDRGSS